jgi:[ribosomal protein S18]-alanine N-acetyltransferase
MMSVRIRKFRKEDASQVAEVMVESFATFFSQQQLSLLKKQFAASRFRKKSLFKDRFSETVSFVALDKKTVVGYLRVMSGSNGLGSLDLIGIRPDYIGKGVGRKLARRADDYWRKKGMRKISTSVSAHNKRALLYYIKLGFVPEGYRRDHFQDGIDEIILGKFYK